MLTQHAQHAPPWLLAGSPLAGDAPDRPIYHGDVEFSGCSATFGPEAFAGRISCNGGQYVPASGNGTVFLEASWRPAP